MGEGNWAELKTSDWEGDLRVQGNGEEEWQEQRSRSRQGDNPTPLQIQQQFINPSLHEIKMIKTAAEKAAESLPSLQPATLRAA